MSLFKRIFSCQPKVDKNKNKIEDKVKEDIKTDIKLEKNK